MPLQEIFSIIAGVTSVMGFAIYIRYIVTGKTKPKALTWLIWAALDTILLYGMIYTNTTNWQIFVAVPCSWIIGLLSLKKGILGWDQIDAFSLVGSIVSIIVWLATKDPTWGIIIVLAITLIGAVPGFKSAWDDPSRENWRAWFPGSVSSVFAVLAVQKHSISGFGQPIVFTLINIAMMGLALRKNKKGIGGDSN